jgi:hypothetical protein
MDERVCFMVVTTALSTQLEEKRRTLESAATEFLGRPAEVSVLWHQPIPDARERIPEPEAKDGH